MKTWVTLAVLTAVSCVDNAADSGGHGRRCGIVDGPEPPADICALADTNELMECDRAPFHYSRRRDGTTLRIECHVVGDLPPRASEYRRWIGDRGDVSIVSSLRGDWSVWPMAECDLEFTVATFSRIGQEIPDNVRVQASMWSQDSTAMVGVLPPLAADSIVFTASECTYEAPERQ
jgi:hypothetical protein